MESSVLALRLRPVENLSQNQHQASEGQHKRSHATRSTSDSTRPRHEQIALANITWRCSDANHAELIPPWSERSQLPRQRPMVMQVPLDGGYGRSNGTVAEAIGSVTTQWGNGSDQTSCSKVATLRSAKSMKSQGTRAREPASFISHSRKSNGARA